MDMLAFPLRFAEPQKVQDSDTVNDEPVLPGDDDGKNAFASDNATEETFAEHMNKEPEHDKPALAKIRDHVNDADGAVIDEEVDKIEKALTAAPFGPTGLPHDIRAKIAEAVRLANMRETPPPSVKAPEIDLKNVKIDEVVLSNMFGFQVGPEIVQAIRHALAGKTPEAPAIATAPKDAAQAVELDPQIRARLTTLLQNGPVTPSSVMEALKALSFEHKTAPALIAIDEARIEPQLDLSQMDFGGELDSDGVEMIKEFLSRDMRAAKPAMAPAAQAVSAVMPLTGGEFEPELAMTSFRQDNGLGANLTPVTPTASANTTLAAQTAASISAATAAQMVAAVKTDKNTGNFEVRLDPPEMGRVRISFSMETAEAVKAVLTVERAETLDYLRRNVSQFAEELRMAGFSSVDLEFSEHGASEFADEPEHFDMEADHALPMTEADKNIVYLSLRDNAQLNLLV